MVNLHSRHCPLRMPTRRSLGAQCLLPYGPAAIAGSDRRPRRGSIRKLKTGWRVLGLLLFLLLATSNPLQAAASDAGSVPDTAGDYLNLAEHHDGRYELHLSGARVAVTLTTTRSPVRDWGPEPTQPLFTVPEAFRPPFPILRLVEGQPVQADGTPYPNPPVPRSFLLQVDADGAVRYADTAWVEEVVYLAYTLHTVWGTTPAANDRTVLEILDKAWFGETVLSAVPPPEQTEVPEKVFRGWTIPAHRVGPFATINLDGRVTALGAPGAWFHGSLRPELGQLHHLERLELNSTSSHLWGPSRRYGIQESLEQSGKLPPETGLLDGEIPPQLGQLSRLRHLDLSGHLLTGSIPPELGRLVSLESLDLHYNLLTDSIPGTLGQLGHLGRLNLAANRLSGRLPPELGQLSRLEWVHLQNNRLAGCLPLTWQARNIEVVSHDNLIPEESEPLPFCQDENRSARQFVGDYANLAENWEGRVHLEVQDNTVYATLQTVRSPVQYFARQQPEVLFTVPAGFRPATALVWEVGGRPVRADGAPDPARRDIPVFRMSVDTEGHVRYVDDLGVDGTGYLRYRTVLAWPLAGVQPQVCERSQAVQAAILTSLALPGAPEEACAAITWGDLAGIQTLKIDAFAMGKERPQPDGRFYHVPFLPDDLAGLSGLEGLHVYNSRHSRIPVQLPSRFLDHVPLLRDLVFSNVYLTRQPADFLTRAPSLRSLFLELAGDNPYLPDGFLYMTPQLQFLDLRLDGDVATPLSSDFLRHASQLQVLRIHLHGGMLSPWPPGLLVHAPKLEVLALDIDGNGLLWLPFEFLSHAPRLLQARIWGTPISSTEPPPILKLEAPRSFLAHAPLLEQLWLKRVDAGPQFDFVHALPETTQIHWVHRDGILLPTAAALSLEPARHWLHLMGRNEVLNMASDYSGVPLNIVTDGIEGALGNWLPHQTVHGLTVVTPYLYYSDPTLSSRQLSALQLWLGSLPRDGLKRLTVLLNGETALPSHWGRGRSYDWMYLSDYLASSSDAEVLGQVDANVLLLRPATPLAGVGWPYYGWRSADRQVLRELMQAPKAQHLGLILEVGGTRSEGAWVLPAKLLDDMDFECIELDLRMQEDNALSDLARSDLASPHVDLHGVPGGNAAVWWSSSESLLVPLTWNDADWTYHHRVLWSRDPVWFAEEHLAWVREQGCTSSLYLHFTAGTVSLEAGILSQPGALRSLRIVHSEPPCPDCSAR